MIHLRKNYIEKFPVSLNFTYLDWISLQSEVLFWLHFSLMLWTQVLGIWLFFLFRRVTCLKDTLLNGLKLADNDRMREATNKFRDSSKRSLSKFKNELFQTVPYQQIPSHISSQRKIYYFFDITVFSQNTYEIQKLHKKDDDFHFKVKTTIKDFNSVQLKFKNVCFSTL